MNSHPRHQDWELYPTRFTVRCKHAPSLKQVIAKERTDLVPPLQWIAALDGAVPSVVEYVIDTDVVGLDDTDLEAEFRHLVQESAAHRQVGSVVQL